MERIRPSRTHENNNNNKNYKIVIIAVIMIIFGILSLILKDNKTLLIIMTLPFGLSFVGLIISVISLNKKKKAIQKSLEEEAEKQNNLRREIQNEIDKIQLQIGLLQKSNDEQMQMINMQQKAIQEKYANTNNNYENVSFELERLQDDITSTKLKVHELELDKNNIMPKLEKLSEMEERLDELNQREENLLKDNEAMELAKKVLEIAYIKMKENVTPKFTENLSKNIEKISDGKYKNVRINDEEGIIVEKDNGQYVKCEKLSVGTIDQLYLSLRFGAIKELSKESMPIILDEAFAYYDKERLTNILTYINDEFKDNQIIIFTCTNREKEVLEELHIEYNSVNL